MLELAVIILSILCLCGSVQGNTLAIVTLAYCSIRIINDIINLKKG